MVVHIQHHESGSHGLRGDTNLLDRFRRGTTLTFKRHIVERFPPSRFLHESYAVDLECGGEGETNRTRLLWHLDGQPVLCDERMLLRNDLYE